MCWRIEMNSNYVFRNLDSDDDNDDTVSNLADGTINDIIDKFRVFNNSNELVSKKIINLYESVKNPSLSELNTQLLFSQYENYIFSYTDDRMESYYEKAAIRIEKIIKTLSVRFDKNKNVIILLETIKKKLNDDEYIILSSYGIDLINHIWENI